MLVPFLALLQFSKQLEQGCNSTGPRRGCLCPPWNPMEGIKFLLSSLHSWAEAKIPALPAKILCLVQVKGNFEWDGRRAISSVDWVFPSTTYTWPGGLSFLFLAPGGLGVLLPSAMVLPGGPRMTCGAQLRRQAGKPLLNMKRKREPRKLTALIQQYSRGPKRSFAATVSGAWSLSFAFFTDQTVVG